MNGRTITESAVAEIANQVFKENFVRLVGDAQSIAYARAQEFTRKALAELATLGPSALEKFSDPLFLQNFYTSQRHGAMTGDADLEAVLVSLLCSLTTSKARSLREICVSEAIEKAGRLTRSQLSILT